MCLAPSAFAHDGIKCCLREAVIEVALLGVVCVFAAPLVTKDPIIDVRVLILTETELPGRDFTEVPVLRLVYVRVSSRT